MFPEKSDHKLFGCVNLLDTKIIEIVGELNQSKSTSQKLIGYSPEKIDGIKTIIKEEFKDSLLEEYETEFTIYKEISDSLLDLPPNIFSMFIIIKAIQNLEELNRAITLLKSARSISKQNDLGQSIVEKMENLIEVYHQFLTSFKQIQDKSFDLFQKFIIKKPEFKVFRDDIGYFGKTEMFELSNPIDCWYYFNKIKKTTYNQEKKKQNTPLESAMLPLLIEIKESIKKQKKNEQALTIRQIEGLNEFKKLVEGFLAINQKSFTQSTQSSQINISGDQISMYLLYIMFKKEFISEDKENFIDTMARKQIKAELIEFVQTAYKKNLIVLLGDIAKRDKLGQENIENVLSKYISMLEKDLEQKLACSDLPETDKKAKFQEEVTSIYDILNKLNDWLLGIQSYLEPYQDIIGRYIKAIERIREDLDLKCYNYNGYIDNVIEQNILSGVNCIIDDKVKQLESLIKEYETQTLQLIDKEIPQSFKLEQILEDFEQRFKNIDAEVSRKFKEYKEKQLNIYESITKWEKKFEEIKNRVRFVVSSLLESLFKKYEEVIEKEKNFFIRISEESIRTEGDFTSTFSIDMILPEKLTEKQIRERMNNIDRKIKDLDSIKNSMLKERQKYEEFLKEYLKKNDELVSQKCVVCYKEIDVVNDHFIKCDFCNRLMHYMCGAWWLEKHNSCPVCNNAFVVPNSEMYNQSELSGLDEDKGNVEEHDDDAKVDSNEGYIEPDLDKYPPELDKDIENEPKDAPKDIIKNDKNIDKGNEIEKGNSKKN